MSPGARELPYQKDRDAGRAHFSTENQYLYPTELSLRVDRGANWEENKRKIKELYFIISVVKMRLLKHVIIHSKYFPNSDWLKAQA